MNKKTIQQTDQADFSTMPFLERRNFPRFFTKNMNMSIELEISLGTDQNVKIISGNVINLSKQGIAIYTAKLFSLSQKVNFKLNIPHSYGSIQGKGRVIWGMEQENNFKYGIHFYYFHGEEVIRKIEQYLNDHISQLEINKRRKKERRKEKHAHVSINKRKADRRKSKLLFLKKDKVLKNNSLNPQGSDLHVVNFLKKEASLKKTSVGVKKSNNSDIKKEIHPSFFINERRKSIRLIQGDKKKFSERRQDIRIKASFPVQLKIKNCRKDIPAIITANVIDIDIKGVKIISDYFIPLNAILNIVINFSPYYSILELESKVIWNTTEYKNDKYCTALSFSSSNTNLMLLKKILNKLANKISVRPKVQFIKQPLNICHKMSGVDLQIGCKYKCLYCYFSDILNRSYSNWFEDKAVDISPIYDMKTFPPLIYLSPFSDPFSSITKNLTHELLSFLLPKGIKFLILTKGIIPSKTIKLIKNYSQQIEVGIGVTNLDEKRNSILEPNCPSAQERLSNLPKLAKTGCRIWIRMDPLIPNVDDPSKILKNTIINISKIIIPDGFSASYLFLTRTSLKALNKVPLIKKSLKLFTERSPTSMGMALSIPFDFKKAKYAELSSLCKSIGSELYICSCKDIRFKNLKDVDYNLRCHL